MFIKLTNKYLKDEYDGYYEHCNTYHIKEEDLIRFSSERGRDIESNFSDRYKQNYYVYFNEKGTTRKIQIDWESYLKLKDVLDIKEE